MPQGGCERTASHRDSASSVAGGLQHPWADTAKIERALSCSFERRNFGSNAMKYARQFTRLSISLCGLLVTGIASIAAAPSAKDISGVGHVIDGDTVEVNAVKIRLDAIDAPETDQLCLNERS